jgi:hypothetical protein
MAVMMIWMSTAKAVPTANLQTKIMKKRKRRKKSR